MVCSRDRLFVILVVRGFRVLVCVLDSEETLPLPHDIIYRWSLRGVRVPAPLDKLPHLDGEADSLSILRKLRPFSSKYPARGRRASQSFERVLAGEDLDGQHRKGKNVCGLGLHDHLGSARTRFDDFWGEPARVSGSGLSCHRADAGVDGGETIICQQRMAMIINENVRLWARKSVGVSGLVIDVIGTG